MKSELKKDVMFWLKSDVVKKKALQKAVELERGLHSFLKMYNRIAAEDCPSAQTGSSCYHIALYLMAEEGPYTKANLRTFLEAVRRASAVGVGIGLSTGFLPSLASDIGKKTEYFLEIRKEIFSTESSLKREYIKRVNSFPKRFRGEYPARCQKILLYNGKAKWDSGITMECKPRRDSAICKGDERRGGFPLYNCQETVLTVESNFVTFSLALVRGATGILTTRIVLFGNLLNNLVRRKKFFLSPFLFLILKKNLQL